MVSTPEPTHQQQQRFCLIFDKLKFLLVHFFSPLLFLLNSFFHGKNKSEVDLGMGKICYNPSRNAAAAATPPEPAWIRCLKRGEEMDAGDQGEAHKGRKLEHRPTNNQLHTHTHRHNHKRARCARPSRGGGAFRTKLLAGANLQTRLDSARQHAVCEMAEVWVISGRGRRAFGSGKSRAFSCALSVFPQCCSHS